MHHHDLLPIDKMDECPDVCGLFDYGRCPTPSELLAYYRESVAGSLVG